MRKFFTALIVIPLGLLFVVFAVANRHFVTVSFDPFNTRDPSISVTICGLSARETLGAALDAGADMVGFVFFPPSPRHLSLEQARQLGSQAKGRALKVALSVDADDATLTNIVDTLQPDILQLHGR